MRENTCRKSVTHGEVVCKRASGGNGALSDLRGAIHVDGAIHEEAVEVQRGRLVAQLVVHIDDDVVADVCIYARDGPLAVDADGGAVEGAVGIGRDPANVEVVRHGGSLGQQTPQLAGHQQPEGESLEGIHDDDSVQHQVEPPTIR